MSFAPFLCVSNILTLYITFPYISTQWAIFSVFNNLNFKVDCMFCVNSLKINYETLNL